VLLCRAVRAGSPRMLVTTEEVLGAVDTSEPMDRGDIPHLRLMDQDTEDL